MLHIRPIGVSYAQKYYRTDPQKNLARQHKRRAIVKAWVTNYKAMHPCVDCGEADPIVLDFDHREPKEKSFSISNIATRGGGASIKTLEAEIGKCDVRCSNCHRRKPEERRASK
jgi:lysozyme family protein